jgi:hypothetical protein
VVPDNVTDISGLDECHCERQLASDGQTKNGDANDNQKLADTDQALAVTHALDSLATRKGLGTPSRGPLGWVLSLCYYL